jgi:glucose-6-phosphate dehydrogenase assembly protein OpcA
MHRTALLVGHLWEWMAALLTWSKVARECETGEAEIERVVHLAVALGARYEATGQIELTEAEQQIARDGSIVMDLLAELVDVELADAVGAWSRREIAQLRQPR